MFQVMRRLYLELLRRGFSREEAIDAIPYSIDNKSSQHSKRMKVKRNDSNAKVPIPSVGHSRTFWSLP